MRICSFVFAVAVCPAFLLPLSAQPDNLPVVVKKDIVYGTGGKQKLMLDLAMPKEGNGPFPVIMCIHGGGWRAGSRQQLSDIIKKVAAEKYVSVTISYRLAPKFRFPAPIEDCKAAVRWLRANAAKYKINPKKIGVVGFSAGAHLACLLGAADKSAGLEGKGGNPGHSSRVHAVVSFFGPTDTINKTWSKAVEDFYLVPFFGGTFEKARATYRRASPLIYVSKDDPPFLFFHGDKDTLVGIYHSRVMRDRLKKAGVSARLVEMKGAGHGWGGEKFIQSYNQTMKFFGEQLQK